MKSDFLLQGRIGLFLERSIFAKSSWLWGNISVREQAKNMRVKLPPALCCHNTFG